MQPYQLPPEVEGLVVHVSDNTKLDIEIYKHLTTLSTGAIVLLGTFIDKLTPAKTLRAAIPTAIVCFLICIVYSVKSIFMSRAIALSLTGIKTALIQGTPEKRMENLDSIAEYAKKIGRQSAPTYYIVQISFVLGIGAIGAFVIANMR